MKRKIFTLTIIAVFMAFNGHLAFGQNKMEGKVENASGEALQFASVYLLEGQNGEVVQSVPTNESGFFIMEPDSITAEREMFIYARYLLESSDTIRATFNTQLLLVVRNGGIVNLDEVVITANRPSIVQKADRIVFTPSEDMRETGTTLDIIKMAPLIDYDPKNEAFNIINKGNTTVYINNQKSNLPREMITSLLRTTPSKYIESIEIITNPGSEYPGNNTGGIIIINLKRNLDEGFMGSLMLASEQSVLNTSILNGSLNYRKGKVGIRVSPFLTRSFNYETSENQIINSLNRVEDIDGEYERKYLVLGGGLGIDYDMDKNLFSANGFISFVNGNSDQDYFTWYSTKGNTTMDSTYFTPLRGTDFYLYNFGNVFFEHRFDSVGNRKLTFNFDYNQYKDESVNNGSIIDLSSSDLSTLYRTEFPKGFLNLSASADFSSVRNETSKINLGIQASNSNFTNILSYYNFNRLTASYEVDNLLTSKHVFLENYVAFYYSHAKTVNEKFDINYGLRGEGTDYQSENKTSGVKVDSSYFNLFPNLSMSYSVNENHAVSLALSRKIQRPELSTLMPGRRYFNSNFYEENNPFLLPAMYYNAEATYTLKNTFYFTFGYSQQNNQYDLFVVPVIEIGEEMQKKTYINYGKEKKSYFQFYTRQSAFDKIWTMNFSGSLNYVVYEDTEGAILNENITNLNYSLYWNNGVYISRKNKLMALAYLRYLSPVQNISYVRLNPLFKFDIGLNKGFKNGRFSLYFSDLFNTYGKTSIEYRTSGPDTVNLSYRNEYTQRVTLSLNYYFGNKGLKTIQQKESANEDIKGRL